MNLIGTSDEIVGDQMQFFSKELVLSEFRQQLRRDLDRAIVCRFFVAYVSKAGIESIGAGAFARPFRDPRSFGVASLSCSCGHEPLLWLQNKLGRPAEDKLKYFMDPMVSGEDEPKGIALLHSKLVYLLFEDGQTCAMYIGSHNWTRRALGEGGPRNAEASLRLEAGIAPGDLDGTSATLAGQVNRHLLRAWDLSLCISATEDNRRTFEEWHDKGCGRRSNVRVTDVTVLLAVHQIGSPLPAPGSWRALAGQSIYLQVLNEDDGELIWRGNDDRMMLLVWKSDAALAAARQPVIIICRISSKIAGPTSRRQGTNQSNDPIVGFQAVVYDEAQLLRGSPRSSDARDPIRIWTGREVGVYDFSFPARSADSSQVDNGVRPKYQFCLEVESVAFPADRSPPFTADLIWTRESFAVAKDKKSATVKAPPGYRVSPDDEKRMRGCLREVFSVDPELARVAPYSGEEDPLVGKPTSLHPLHETFIDAETLRHPESYYSTATPGVLLANLASQAPFRSQDELLLEIVPRVQRVFTVPLNTLANTWRIQAIEMRRQCPLR